MTICLFMNSIRPEGNDDFVKNMYFCGEIGGKRVLGSIVNREKTIHCACSVEFKREQLRIESRMRGIWNGI